MSRNILIVEDEPQIRKIIKGQLTRRHWNVTEAACCREAEAILSEKNIFEVILCDLNLPDGMAWQLLDQSSKRTDQPALIVITGAGLIDNAITALRHGASDFLQKPFTGDQLDDALVRACTRGPLRIAMAEKVEPIEHWRCENAPRFLGTHPKIMDMLQTLRRVAETSVSVLITGGSGTGKELVARAIHTASDRRLKPLITLNCAAISEALIESELFGHVRGAFTGATEARQGHFVAAHTGSIFLDEVGDLPLPMQTKLLRVLQEREVVPVGQSRAISIDTRIIAATNVDLEQAVADGNFREDLYYRLNVVPIKVPALRDRLSDIQSLVSCLIERHNKRLGCSVSRIDADALDCLEQHDWPGNVRELENTIERMVLLKGDGELKVSDLPENLRRESARVTVPVTEEMPTDGVKLRDAVESFEENLIEQALARAGGNKAKAARLLSVSRTTLVEKVKRMNSSSSYMKAIPDALPERSFIADRNA
jgi:DNA-binding NtrC family response regulator